MYLKELTINGFKSFAKKGEFEFSSAITAIVGPNGSGKSNVAESFRFVLGEQSVKSMRGKKGEDLIWGGSEKVTRGNRAAVEVVFDNSKRTFALDFDEVKIDRVVHRDGQNEYKINGSAVRLKDVHELLANANIGSTGHHIISQGEADRVLSAGPKERREMIEDALGLKIYQLKKQEADRKLAKTLENISQVESLRREAAPHLRYLKKQVERAERSLQVQAELKTAYIEYLCREDTYIAKRTDILTKSKQSPQKTLAETEDKIATVQTIVDEQVKPLEDSAEIQEAKETAVAATEAWQLAQNDISQLEGQITFLKRRLESQEASKTTVKKIISYDALSQLVSEVEESVESAMRSNDTASLMSLVRDVVKKLKSFIQDKSEELPEPSVEDAKELDMLEKKLTVAKEEMIRLLEKKQTAQEKLSLLQSSHVNELQEKREAEKELFVLMQQRRDIESTLRTIDSELTMLERDRADFKSELQEAVTLIGRAAAQYYELEILDENGERLDKEAIVAEDRNKQRERRHTLEKLKIRLEELGVGGTDDLLKEYKEAQERDEFLAKELSDLNQSVQNLNTLITEMQAKLEEQFVAGVDKITTEFDKFFKLMFGGGAAKLDRVTVKKRGADDEDTEDEISHEGVELNVALPNKRVKGLEMLSGGERALTSIALIFAMSQVNPPPFIILDETDAALDEANSRRYGDMIEALAQKSQLVLITHNRETMSRAGILYGITMGIDGVSKVLSVKFDDAVLNAK